MFHESSDINNASNMDIADWRQILRYGCARLERSVADCKTADAVQFSQACINSNCEWVRDSGRDDTECISKISGMDRVIKSSVQIRKGMQCHQF